jgi:prolyl-tRNA synthetase
MILPLNHQKSHRVRDTADTLYRELTAAGRSVLMDDRPLRPGVMFADAELLGIPHVLVVGDRGLDSGVIEYRRRGQDNSEIELEKVVSQLS